MKGKRPNRAEEWCEDCMHSPDNQPDTCLLGLTNPGAKCDGFVFGLGVQWIGVLLEAARIEERSEIDEINNLVEEVDNAKK